MKAALLTQPFPCPRSTSQRQLRFSVVASLTTLVNIFFWPLNGASKVFNRALGWTRDFTQQISASSCCRRVATATKRLPAPRTMSNASVEVSAVNAAWTWGVDRVQHRCRASGRPSACSSSRRSVLRHRPEQLDAFAVHAHDVVLCFSAPHRELCFFFCNGREGVFPRPLRSVSCLVPLLLVAFVVAPPPSATLTASPALPWSTALQPAAPPLLALPLSLLAYLLQKPIAPPPSCPCLTTRSRNNVAHASHGSGAGLLVF